MRMIGYVPPIYEAQAMSDNMNRRRRSNDLNYQRQVYETIENNDTTSLFGQMLDNEMQELRMRTHKMSYDYEVM